MKRKYQTPNLSLSVFDEDDIRTDVISQSGGDTTTTRKDLFSGAWEDPWSAGSN